MMTEKHEPQEVMKILSIRFLSLSGIPVLLSIAVILCFLLLADAAAQSSIRTRWK